MRKIAPLTKVLLASILSLWAMMIHSPYLLGLLVIAEFIALSGKDTITKTYKAVLSLVVFAAVLVIFQYLFGVGFELSICLGLRMIVMTLVFIILLATTRIQDLTASMVKQCHIPYEYAFMLTAALRFIPEFIAESKAVQEAQACRGYKISTNPLKRLYSYTTVIQPLVLRAVTRSETMAMSMELRGFGSSRRSFSGTITLQPIDYIVLTMLVIGTLLITLGQQ